VKKALLLGDWVHAHERDRDGATVYVGSEEPLPPSRGRQRFKFLDDGTFLEGRPGADDRAVKDAGTYELDGSRLVLHRDGASQPVVFEASCNDDGSNLSLKKLA
jgi:hypothetical protein